MSIHAIPPAAQDALRALYQEHGLHNTLEALAAMVAQRENLTAQRSAAAVQIAANAVRDALAGR